MAVCSQKIDVTVNVLSSCFLPLSGGGDAEFPILELGRLDEMINRPRWVVPVLPKGELEVLLDASIRLSKEGNCFSSPHIFPIFSNNDKPNLLHLNALITSIGILSNSTICLTCYEYCIGLSPFTIYAYEHTMKWPKANLKLIVHFLCNPRK